MSKTVVIHQPDFLSYLGFFHRLLHADQFIILDHVQFVKGSSRSWMNRDKIKTAKGATWLTISVEKCHRDTAINQVVLSEKIDWKTRNLNLLRQHYGKAPFFSEVHPYVEKLYTKTYTRLVDFNMESIRMLCDLFDLRIDMLFSSDLHCHATKNQLLVEILSQVGATHYLSGVGAKDYFDPEPFKSAAIEVVWQNFTHPIYPQMYDDFLPGLSSIDLLYNCGIEKTRTILRSCE